MKWRVVLESDSETGDWAVWCPDLPGCVSAGETEEEALENIKEAITLDLEPNPIKLKSGAVLREVSVDGNNMNMLNIWCV
ncbi:MAG: type II toxin-antitoxin system HicB family antitoxin [Limnoraphis sp. WC205]|nr:type II toxin-antitoxin system HicB family antitoxin [Limnoraphis sp. WC205]